MNLRLQAQKVIDDASARVLDDDITTAAGELVETWFANQKPSTESMLCMIAALLDDVMRLKTEFPLEK